MYSPSYVIIDWVCSANNAASKVETNAFAPLSAEQLSSGPSLEKSLFGNMAGNVNVPEDAR